MCGKNEYLYKSVLAYRADKFLSCDDFVAVMGAAWSWNVINRNMNLVMQNLEKQTQTRGISTVF